uniref:Uncharacterized protein n=1 Tax=Spongospora subterranea TaxID=70186 RepID=A0A0H5R8B3_9EUKA|eukprot:CRZ10373.1 hypothetical protein [Spongospora subterranea]
MPFLRGTNLNFKGGIYIECVCSLHIVKVVRPVGILSQPFVYRLISITVDSSAFPVCLASLIPIIFNPAQSVQCAVISWRFLLWLDRPILCEKVAVLCFNVAPPWGFLGLLNRLIVVLQAYK